MSDPGKDTRRSGLLFGVGAYASWGLFPAFFPLLKPASAFEILAHRIVWCFVLMVVVIAAVRRLGDIRAITPRTWLLLTFASALISVNWVIYIYAVNNGHVVDAALGYFINPLVTVALGLLVFRERLNRAQFVALAIAVIAVVVLTVEVGSPPIIGIGLALSFGLYGAVKKVVPTDPRVSVGIEAAIASPFALAYIVVLQVDGRRHVHQPRPRPRRSDGHVRRAHGIAAAVLRRGRPAVAHGDDGPVVLPDACDAADLGRGRRA